MSTALRVQVVKAAGGPRVGIYHNATVPAQIWDRITMPDSEDGCWLWQGAVQKKGGYASARVSQRSVLVHRLIYQALVGPTDMLLDHLCRVRYCVNPAHLEPVTLGENIRRGRSHFGERTHCKRNHPFDEENTFFRADGGWRGCRTCRRDNERVSRKAV